MKVVLSIAGSDSSGHAGIQADLKTFSALGVFGSTAVTAITSQNSRELLESRPVPAPTIWKQISAIVSDMNIDAVKIGMLASREAVEIVALAIQEFHLSPVILDPVLEATAGGALLDPEATVVLREMLLPAVTLLTPNLDELSILTGTSLSTDENDLVEAGQQLLEMGPVAVLVKGGHRSDDPVDILITREGVHRFAALRVETGYDRGTGCSLSSAIAAFLARGYPLPEAIGAAKDFLTEALRQGFSVSQESGSPHHFWPFYGSEGLS